MNSNLDFKSNAKYNVNCENINLVKPYFTYQIQRRCCNLKYMTFAR